MEYIQGIPSQTALFLLSIGFGFLLGLLYDVFRTLRLALSDAKGFVFAMDFIYFAACGILSFFFLLVKDEGRLRIYTLSGEALGWMIYYFSLGAVVMRFSDTLVRLLKRVTLVLIMPIKFFFRKIKNLIAKTALILPKRIKKS